MAPGEYVFIASHIYQKQLWDSREYSTDDVEK